MPQPEHRSAAFWLRPWLAKPGQQKRVRAKAVDGGTIYFCSIIQNLGRMFHTQQPKSTDKILCRKMGKLCKKEKQQTRLAGLLLLMRYSSVRREIIQQR